MISSRERGLTQLLIAFQVFAATLLFWAIFAVYFPLTGEPYPSIQTYAKYSIIVIVTMTFEAISRPASLRFRPGRVRRIAGAVSRRQLIWCVAAILFLTVFSRDYALSRGFLAIFIGFCFVLLFCLNLSGVLLAGKLASKYLKKWRLRTAVIGPKSWCESIVPELNFSTGMLDLQDTIFSDEEGLVDESDFLKRVPVASLDLLVLPSRSIAPEIVIRLIREGDRYGYRCWMPVEYNRKYGRRFSMQKVGRLDVLTPPLEPLENTSNQLIKRVFDFLFSLMVCVTILPVAVGFVWILHRLFSPGPLFFKQERVGRNGEPFQVYKFRSLNVENGDAAQQVSKDDDRIFRGGRFIRKSSLDEIPQFINVLRGEMSVVGPRPHMGEHDDEFAGFYESYGQRRYVKPGVTGLAQAKGFRGEVNRSFDLRHRARLDRFYVLHWHFAFDMKIILLTFRSVVRPPKTAY